MTKSLLPEKYHHFIYIFSIILLVIGLPLSKFLMSVSQIILIGNWLLEGNLKTKLNAFLNNKTALIISSVILMHLLGLIYTSDFNYAFKDIRIKAPLLVLPLIFSSSKPISKKEIHIILYFFIAAIVLGTLISSSILLGIAPIKIVDVRSASIFISHIRFSLLICIAIFISSYFFINNSFKRSKLIWATIICWLIIFLIIVQSMTGLSVLCFTSFVLTIYYLLISKSKAVKIAGLTTISILLFSSFIYLKKIFNEVTQKEKIDTSQMEQFTKYGNQYHNDLNNKLTENSHYIWTYISDIELEEAWNQRSSRDFLCDSLKSGDAYYTLIRFLASKGWKKDKDAVNALTQEEINAIEQGITNVKFLSMSGLEKRIYETVWELDVYKNSKDANGHSLTQRFEYWKTAVTIIKKNILFGVGTGDLPKAFEEEYNNKKSSLWKEFRLRSHNQFLSITVAFGIIGLVWFLVTLAYPILVHNKKFNYLYTTFFLTAILSFLTEDTLETQAGVTFFAFFNAFFLFILPSKSNSN